VPRPDLHRRVDEALALVRLEDQASKLPAQLSGGQQQRVAIARAVVYEPPLVLMDEPLSNLDAQLRLAMRTEIRRLHQTLGLTTIYVTHDQEEALSMADRLVLLREGVVQQVGTPDEVYDHPANRYVAGFMGYRNMLEFDVESAAEGSAVLASKDVRLTGRTFGSIEAKRAVAAIRPEDIVVDGPGPNRMQVTAEVVEYHGRELLILARLPAGEALYFRTEKRFVAGDPITVSVPPERVLVYPADAPAAPTEAVV
jgi:putative spermidine/putrescine transport system ATP-binding protein